MKPLLLLPLAAAILAGSAEEAPDEEARVHSTFRILGQKLLPRSP